MDRRDFLQLRGGALSARSAGRHATTVDVRNPPLDVVRM
jgi:hypothetical protein